MAKIIKGIRRSRSDEAILNAVMVHGVPVNILAQAVGLSRQSVYRRMQRARISRRQAAALASRQADTN